MVVVGGADRSEPRLHLRNLGLCLAACKKIQRALVKFFLGKLLCARSNAASTTCHMPQGVARTPRTQCQRSASCGARWAPSAASPTNPPLNAHVSRVRGGVSGWVSGGGGGGGTQETPEMWWHGHRGTCGVRQARHTTPFMCGPTGTSTLLVCGRPQEPRLGTTCGALGRWCQTQGARCTHGAQPAPAHHPSAAPAHSVRHGRGCDSAAPARRPPGGRRRCARVGPGWGRPAVVGMRAAASNPCLPSSRPACPLELAGAEPC